MLSRTPHSRSGHPLERAARRRVRCAARENQTTYSASSASGRHPTRLDRAFQQNLAWLVGIYDSGTAAPLRFSCGRRVTSLPGAMLASIGCRRCADYYGDHTIAETIPRSAVAFTGTVSKVHVSKFRRCPLPHPIDDTVDAELSSCSSCQTAWSRCMNVDAHRLRRSCISSLLSLMRTWTWIDSLTSRLRAGLV